MHGERSKVEIACLNMLFPELGCYVNSIYGEDAGKSQKLIELQLSLPANKYKLVTLRLNALL